MVSIIVCFYERLDHLKACLDALALCAADFDEVVVADDGSKATTVDHLKK
jgi:glycosyltransferase involved in cell wall biosynthesis